MNTRKNMKHTLLGIGLLGISVLSVGCQGQKTTLTQYPAMTEPQPVISRNNCTLDEKNRFGHALIEVRKDLGNDSCYPAFDHYLTELIGIAGGDSDLLRRKDFSEFLVWSAEQGIINKKQAKDIYNRYFTSSFVSLPDEYNVCSQCRNQVQIENAMYQELVKKKEGMATACNDQKSYDEARSHYDSLLLFLDATCTACDEG